MAFLPIKNSSPVCLCSAMRMEVTHRAIPFCYGDDSEAEHLSLNRAKLPIPSMIN